MAKKPKPPSASTVIKEALGPKFEDVVHAFEPEPGDRPIGAYTDAQLGAAIRLICAQGHAAMIFRHEGQLYLRVVNDA